MVKLSMNVDNIVVEECIVMERREESEVDCDVSDDNEIIRNVLIFIKEKYVKFL